MAEGLQRHRTAKGKEQTVGKKQIPSLVNAFHARKRIDSGNRKQKENGKCPKHVV